MNGRKLGLAALLLLLASPSLLAQMQRMELRVQGMT
jgi:hypothetical protein